MPDSHLLLKSIKDAFLIDLSASAKGEKTSLVFEKTIFPDSQTRKEEAIQVMVIGGTNFSEALVEKAEDMRVREFSEQKEFQMFRSADDIFSLILENLRSDISHLAINFAYPMKNVMRKGRIDGILTKEVKGHAFKDALGKPLGAQIENFIFQKTQRVIKIAVANDALCLLLSGLSSAPRDQLVGVVVGTGYNMGFFLDKDTMVNLEAGRFDQFPASESGKMIMRDIHSSVLRKFEMEVSGAYLYRHFNYLVLNNAVAHKKISSTYELFQIAFGERDAVQEIAYTLIKRSAGFVAAQISGMAEFKNSDIAVIFEGSLLTQQYVNMMSEVIPELTKFTVHFYKIKDSSIVGGANLL